MRSAFDLPAGWQGATFAVPWDDAAQSKTTTEPWLAAYFASQFPVVFVQENHAGNVNHQRYRFDVHNPHDLTQFESGCPRRAVCRLSTTQTRLARQGDCPEPRVDSERTQDVADVVSHRFPAQVEILGDLARRAPEFEEPQHLGLAGRKTWKGGRRRALRGFLDLAEDADHPPAASKRNRS